MGDVSLELPSPGGDRDDWGSKLNSALSALQDAVNTSATILDGSPGTGSVYSSAYSNEDFLDGTVLVNATKNIYGYTISTSGSTNAANLNALIQAVPAGGAIYVPAGTYPIEQAIEKTNYVALIGTDGVKSATIFQCAPGFTDSHMYRNWTASDWTGPETNHQLAPDHTATPIYYDHIEGIAFNIGSSSNVICMAHVHLQERSVVERITFFGGSGTNNIARQLLTNLDTGGQCAGRWREGHFIIYNTGWQHILYLDGSNGGRAPAQYIHDYKLVDCTTPPSGGAPPVNTTDSVFYIQQAIDVYLDIHSESTAPDTATHDSAAVRGVDVSNCVITGNINSGGSVFVRPLFRFTRTGNMPAGFAGKETGPTIRDLYVGGFPTQTLTGMGYGGGNLSASPNYIEDDVWSTNHYGYNATTFFPTRIVNYNGQELAWSQTSGVNFKRELVAPSFTAGLPLNLYQNVKSGVTPSSTANTPGTAVTFTPDSGYLSIVPLIVRIQASTIGTETLTVNLTATRSDGTTSSPTATATPTNLSTVVFSQANLYFLAKNGVYITSLTASVQSSISSSTAQVTVVVEGIES